MAKTTKPKASLLHQLAGTTADAPPGSTARAASEATHQDGFILEVFSVEEDGVEIVAVETGRGRVIRARSIDVEILEPAPGSKHKRVRFQPGKFKYD